MAGAFASLEDAEDTEEGEGKRCGRGEGNRSGVEGVEVLGEEEVGG